ncbi:DUF4865 family protein [Cryobacterium sp. W22_MBD10_FK3]|uniref:DUF4865 family protein n=1 Tax=Cryobacterium sp. W22_MBD10_FK3 TaxID=3240273 RepID=UPI003F912661
MHAMQYEITLPADYDMGIIRTRVATRGSGTDAFDGLGIKAYLIREKNVHGSAVNEYAPFYLWANPAGMNSFLLGTPFTGIMNDFGRPPVRHWTGTAFAFGPADRLLSARFATRLITAIQPDEPLDSALQAALERHDRRQHLDGVHATAVAVDPTSWTIVEFTLRDAPPTSPDGECYEVLHVSAPHIAELADR